MKTAFFATVAGLVLSSTSSTLAQDADIGTEPETTEDASSGAIVTREDIVVDRLDEDGNSIPVLDEDSNQLLDDDGDPVFETDAVGFVQNVETPSGNVHQITKEDGSRAIVTHDFANKPDRIERAERPEKADRPERPDRPEKPEKPDRLGRD